MLRTAGTVNQPKPSALAALIEQQYRRQLEELPPDKRQELKDRIERASKEHQPDPMGGG